MKTQIIKQGIQTTISLSVLLSFLVFGLISCDINEPEKNCNETIRYRKTYRPSEIYILTEEDLDESGVGLLLVGAATVIKDICPDNLLVVTAKVNTKGNEIDDKVKFMRLVWYYRPWITSYGDYLYLNRNEENPNQFVATQTLVPSAMGFYLESPAEIRFVIYIIFYDFMTDSETLNWLENHINNLEFEIDYIKF